MQAVSLRKIESGVIAALDAVMAGEAKMKNIKTEILYRLSNAWSIQDTLKVFGIVPSDSVLLTLVDPRPLKIDAHKGDSSGDNGGAGSGGSSSARESEVLKTFAEEIGVVSLTERGEIGDWLKTHTDLDVIIDHFKLSAWQDVRTNWEELELAVIAIAASKTL